MPHFQQLEFIEGAIITVKHEVDELVIVDDGSRTPYEDADLFHHKNQGTAAAINHGAVLLAKHDWWTWVSADNTYSPGWVRKLLSAADSQTGVVYGGFTWQKPRGPSRYLFTPYDPAHLIKDENCFFGPAFIIRREVWQEAGPHRGKISHDYDHWLRVEEVCWKNQLKIVGVDASLCHYNAHDKRATVLRRHEYDAPHWQSEARKRRGIE